MPKYRITITDKNWKEVKENIQKNILRNRNEANQINRSKLSRPLSWALKRLSGMPYTIDLDTEWVKEKIMIETITCTLPLKDDFYDDIVIGLKVWGKMRIERLNKESEIEKVVYDAK